MDRKANGHSATYIKRQAKKIQKELDIPYHQALNESAVKAGFINWKNFLNKSSVLAPTKRVRISSRPAAPKPAVLGYCPAMSRTRYRRPNSKMQVAAHQEIGALLKVLRNATEEHKRAHNPLKDISYFLDEWVQKEYTDRKELSDVIFFSLYYGDEPTEPERAPSVERKAELVALCRKAKAILLNNYHDCGPVRELQHKLDTAIKWMGTWPAARQEKTYTRAGVTIPGGSFVYLKSRPSQRLSSAINNGTV